MGNVIYYNSEHISIKNNIIKKIDKLVFEGKKMPKQGTEDWLKARKIGGSEISSLFGKNPWKKEVNLIKLKTGLTQSFKGNLYTRWGHIMEVITTKITENIFNTKIKEVNMLYGSIYGQSYSPDGVGIVKLKCEGDNEVQLSNDVVLIRENQHEYFYILFEFKAPFSRIPCGKIPINYIYQIQSGLSVIKEADKSLYIDALYRICSLKDFKMNNRYNTYIHSSDLRREYSPATNIPIALGIIIFYQTQKEKKKFIEFVSEIEDSIDDVVFEPCDDEDIDDGVDLDKLEIDKYIRLHTYNENQDKIESDRIINESMDEVFNNDDYEYCDFYQSIQKYYEHDFGNASRGVLDRLFELIITDKVIKVAYIEPYVINESLKNIDFLYHQDIPVTNKYEDEEYRKINERIMHRNICKEMYNLRHILEKDNDIIGMLPWKMLDCDIILQERDKTFDSQLVPKLERVMNIIDEVNKQQTIEEKNEIINHYYPEEEE